jgi:uncharacterized protein YjbI with pentapeptide repeats
MALAYVAETLGDVSGLVVVEDAVTEPLLEHGDPRVVVHEARETLGVPEVAFQLAPWTRDDWIEYLLARHPASCSRVVGHLSIDADADALGGSPELSALVLDEMAEDDDVRDVATAVRSFVARQSEPAGSEMRRRSFRSLAWDAREAHFGRRGLVPFLIRLLAYPIVREVLGADHLVLALRSGEVPHGLDRPIPDDLILRASGALRGDEAVRVLLEETVSRKVAWRSTIDLLHALDFAWLARYLAECLENGREFPNLSGARVPFALAPGAKVPGVWLAGANCGGGDWAGATLEGAHLRMTDFTDANLAGARLVGADAVRARFVGANLGEVDASKVNFERADLRRTRLAGAELRGADFTGASLGGADLRRAILVEAKLSGAHLVRAHFENALLIDAALEGCDLRHASLEGATFDGADLRKANLEGVEVRGVSFARADLRGALLTASSLPGVRFERADLSETGLADIDWPRANLFGADFTHAVFHLGSSRSGRVGGYPSQGTRTGFYSDDERDQGFKAPEQIRKANLRGADLRGAKVYGTDFYLVDLRDALYTPDQARHFRHCGAILEHRA